VKNQNVVTVLYADFGKLISFNEGYNSKKEDYLFEKLQVKRVKPNEVNGSLENINFNIMKQSLMLNDWNIDEQMVKCNFDKVGDFTQCSYRFTKKSYEVAITTRRKNECLFCSKKPEEVYSSSIFENN